MHCMLGVLSGSRCALHTVQCHARGRSDLTATATANHTVNIIEHKSVIMTLDDHKCDNDNVLQSTAAHEIQNRSSRQHSSIFGLSLLHNDLANHASALHRRRKHAVMMVR